MIMFASEKWLDKKMCIGNRVSKLIKLKKPRINQDIGEWYNKDIRASNDTSIMLKSLVRATYIYTGFFIYLLSIHARCLFVYICRIEKNANLFVKFLDVIAFLIYNTRKLFVTKLFSNKITYLREPPSGLCQNVKSVADFAYHLIG